MAEDMGISDHIFPLGSKPHEEIIPLLMASDMAFYALDENFPAPENSLGVKVLEYIACKLPVLSVAASNASVSKLIGDNKIGIALNWQKKGKDSGLDSRTVARSTISHQYRELLP